MKTFLLDPTFSGCAGDMILALFADESKLREIEKLLSEFRVHLSTEEVEKEEMRCKRLKIEIKNPKNFRDFNELRAETEKILFSRKQEKEFCFKVFETLEKAEEAVHGHIHELHELGSVDTLVDVIGASISLNEQKIYSLPPAVGTAAPAVLEVAKQKKIPLIFKSSKHELTTPTGIAILSMLKQFNGNSFTPLAIKYSAGTLDIPSCLRLIEIEEHNQSQVFAVDKGVKNA